MDTDFVVSTILCDGLIVEKDTEKMTLIGCFNALLSPQMPFMHPGIVVVVQITNIQKDKFDLAVTARLEDKSGHVLASAVAHVKAALRNPETVTDISITTLDVPLRLPPVIFQQPGKYAVKTLVNSEDRHVKWLPVVHVPQPPQKPVQ